MYKYKTKLQSKMKQRGNKSDILLASYQSTCVPENRNFAYRPYTSAENRNAVLFSNTDKSFPCLVIFFTIFYLLKLFVKTVLSIVQYELLLFFIFIVGVYVVWIGKLNFLKTITILGF